MENNPASQIFSSLIGYQLYGKDYNKDSESCQDLKVRLNEISQLKKLRDEPESFWLYLFRKTFTNVCATVEGKPSVAAVEEYAAKEEERLEEQCESLGDDGLRKCGQKIEEAIEKNTVRLAYPLP